MAASGALLSLVAQEQKEFGFYCWLLLFQCVFEVTTAVSTYQVGAEITCAAAMSKPGAVGLPMPNAALPGQARLTLVFSATGVLAGATEVTMQAGITQWKHMETRFAALGLFLLGLAAILLVVRIMEAVLAQRRGGDETVPPALVSIARLGSETRWSQGSEHQ